MSELSTFCSMVRNRSAENQLAMRYLGCRLDTISPAVSILRQELDSMVRVIYLLHHPDQEERRRLVHSTLAGERWRTTTAKGRVRDVTDREMVDLAQSLTGWTQSVYKFGRAFIHLSDFHNHLSQDPFQRLPISEREDLLRHMRHYHGGPHHDAPDIAELATYLPAVLDKIAENLKCYLRDLETSSPDRSASEPTANIDVST